MTLPQGVHQLWRDGRVTPVRIVCKNAYGDLWPCKMCKIITFCDFASGSSSALMRWQGDTCWKCMQERLRWPLTLFKCRGKRLLEFWRRIADSGLYLHELQDQGSTGSRINSKKIQVTLKYTLRLQRKKNYVSFEVTFVKGHIQRDRLLKYPDTMPMATS